MKLTLLVCVAATILVGAPGCSSETPPGAADIQTSRYVYVEREQGPVHLVLHAPADWKASDSRPTIVFFYGGGFERRNMAHFEYQANYFAGRGMVAIRADYRVKGEDGTLAPAAIADARESLRWIRARSSALGVDPERIVVAGGSAGGLMAAATATSVMHVSSQPQLVVMYNPILRQEDPAKVERRWGTQEEADAFAPLMNLAADLPPMLIFFGDADALYPQGEDLVARAPEFDFDVTMHVAAGQDHGFFNRDPWRAETIAITDCFLAEHGFLDGEPSIEGAGTVSMRVVRSGE